MTDSIEVPGGRIAYDVTGDGPLVVLVPGLGDLRSTYRLTVPALVEAGYRAATTDLRGHGGSSAGFGSYTNADTGAGADLAELVDRLGGPAIVVGGSFGGGSAVRLAAERPALVAGLVLIDAFTRPVRAKPLLVPLLKLLGRSPALWGMYYKSLHKGPKPAEFPAETNAAVLAFLRQVAPVANGGA